MRLKGTIMKYRKRKDVNVAVIVFLIIFIYVIINVGIFLTKDHLSIYEVKEGYTSDNNVFTGLILRDEEIFYTQKAGYINYFHRDGDRVGKFQTVYSLSDEKSSLFLGSEDGVSLSSDDIRQIKKETFEFQKKYDNSNFSNVYDFKYELDGLILQLTNDNTLTNITQSVDEAGTSLGLSVTKSNSSGIIAYTMDGMEELKADTVTKDAFLAEDYTKTSLRTMDIVEKTSPVYRLIKSDNWNILIELSDTQYEKIKENERIKAVLGDSGLTATLPIEFRQHGDSYIGILSLDKYMVQFINQRYINIELEHNMAKGLKIPVSSVIEKDFYKIPLEYFTVGGNSGGKGVIVVEEDPNKNETSYNFFPTDLYYTDEEYGYIDGRLFDTNTWIHNEANGERFRIGLSETLKGVFNVNKGYAVFRRIEVLYENEEYYIVKQGTSYGLSVYDHIALVGSTAIEQAIIY